MRRLILLPTLLLAWLAIAAAAMLPGTIPTAMIPANTSALPDNIAIIGRSGPLLIIYSEDRNYVRALYQAGARFVLPARKKTCLDWQNV